MHMQVAETADGILGVTLVGRLDTPGIDQIEARLTAHLVPRGAHAVVDLGQVEFLGSMAVRMFITISRALGRRGGRLALFGAQPLVAQVLHSTALNEIVPVRVDAAAAAAAVRD